MRQSIVAFLLFVIRLGAPLAHAQCKPGDPTGYFEGTATSMQAGKLEVSLNLTCPDGNYSGELVSPVGTYRVDGGAFVDGFLKLQFGAGGDHISVEMQQDSGALKGTFHAGEDRGPVELRRTGEARPESELIPTLDISKAQWHEDVRFYGAELPKRHINAFHHVSREEFQAQITALDQKIDRIDSDAIFVGLARVAALVGDGHTHFNAPDDIANFPLKVLSFGNDYHIVAVAGDTDRRALGARIIKIGDTPFAKARDLLLSLTPQDENPNLGLVVIEQTMTQGLYLHGLGIIPDHDAASYTLVDQHGKEFTIRVRGTKMAESKTWDWTYVSREAPLYRENPNERFWAEYLSESRTVYCNFRGYNTLEKDAPAWMELVKSKAPDKVVIDLRQNGGGDFTLGQKFVIDPLRALPNINKKGHLFVLISPYTFSAAMSNATQFRSTTAAILVGEPIGEKPNSYQEARAMRLPNSHIVARYSTLKYTFVPGAENVVRPDKEIDRDWKSYLAGRDPVLEWVLAHKK